MNNMLKHLKQERERQKEFQAWLEKEGGKKNEVQFSRIKCWQKRIKNLIKLKMREKDMNRSHKRKRKIKN